MNSNSYPVTHQPVHRRTYDPQAVWKFEHDWNTTLCSCKPRGRCCFACCCFPCMGCKIAKYLGETAIIGCCPCGISYLRTKLRTARRIQGSCCGDMCLSSCCCCSCTATQMSCELEAQGLWDPPKEEKPKPMKPNAKTPRR